MNDRVSGLDSLRAIAMTMVIAQHCGLLPFGWTGVWLFFLISGYVITHGFLIEETQFNHVPKISRYMAFMRRRVIRIVPAYFAYLTLCFLVYFATIGIPSLVDIFGLSSFTYNWEMIFAQFTGAVFWPPTAHLWTLSVEQQFYLVFPLFFLWLPRNIRWLVAIFIVLSGPMVRMLWDQILTSFLSYSKKQDYAFATYSATLCHFDAFFLGALLANYENLLSKKAINILLLISVLFTALYSIAYAFVNIQSGVVGIAIIKNIFSGILYGEGRQIWVYSAVNFVALFFLSATVFFVKKESWFANPWLSWVGQVSYGGYLVHALVLWGFYLIAGIQVAKLQVPYRLCAFILVWIVTVFIASISFKYFEQPIAKKYKRWTTPFRTN